jgi:HSP20 family protein
MLKRFDPFKGLRSIERDIMDVADYLMKETFSKHLSPFRGVHTEINQPIHVRRDEDAYYVEAEMPGLTQEAIEISVKGRTLTIKAIKKEDEPGEGTYIRRERPTISLEQSVTFADTVDAEKVEASYKDGILRITLPKTEDAKPRKIQVS